MKSKSYVGITGPTSKEEVSQIRKSFEEFGFYNNFSHQPMIGILASYKTLNKIEVENKRYPKISKIEELLKESGKETFKTIHYNTRELGNFREQLSELISGHYSKGFLDGVQLNMNPPPIKELEKIKKSFPKLKIIFQANNSVLNYGTPEQISETIKNYKDSIDYVLIDASGGRGKDLDMNFSLDLAKKIKQRSPRLNVGFAGGFRGDNVYENCKKLISEFGEDNFSIDAEGGLRDKLSEKYGDDLLNMKKVKDYIKSASEVFKEIL